MDDKNNENDQKDEKIRYSYRDVESLTNLLRPIIKRDDARMIAFKMDITLSIMEDSVDPLLGIVFQAIKKERLNDLIRHLPKNCRDMVKEWNENITKKI